MTQELFTKRFTITNRTLKALLHSDHARKGHLEAEGSVKVATYGIFFLGCPHQGSPKAHTAALLNNLVRVKGHINNNLLKSLREHHRDLEELNAKFAAISQDFDNRFGFEALPTNIVGKKVMVSTCATHCSSTCANQADRSEMVSRDLRNAQCSHVFSRWRPYQHCQISRRE